MRPLLSIIIPTKNRYYTLFSIVDKIISFCDSQIEIIIQDNSDDNSEALEFLKNKSDNLFLKYYYTSSKLSVIENSDLAVMHSTGEYICFIGDDDGVMPYVSKVVAWMKLNSFDVLKAYKPKYHWPGQQRNYLEKDINGSLTLNKFDYHYEILKTDIGLNDTLNKGGTSMDLLPCLYHGIVKRSVLDKIFNKCETFFPGPSPDMANAIALTQFVKEYIYLDLPVVISGKSTRSTGGKGVLHQHISKIEDVPHLPEDTKSEWSQTIPKYWTAATIWAESVVKTLVACGNEEDVLKFNFSYLYAFILIFNSKFKNHIFSDFNYKYKTSKVCYYRIKIFFYRVSFFIKSRISLTKKKNSNVKNIGEAIDIIENKTTENLSLWLKK